MKINLNTGIDRIKEIKKRISECKPQTLCKAEVYDVWQNLFDPESDN